ncbi:DUF2238 domain-containing protein [Leeia oryzae]|uniref:DUF2238 domain-containing protein n=1 Tax=Leeia oryzae TaxID=356662 RepID=UPI000368BD46|nr:DUF2238 domain-containing protein [Leeia oryzae]
MTPSKVTSTLIMALIFILTWLNPLWPVEQGLHTSLTVIGLAGLWYYMKKHPLDDLHYGLIMLFLSVHALAAHWLYSYVPYEQWLKSAFGFTLAQQLGWHRNNFDRLVHFLYGFCFTPAIAGYALQRWTKGRKQAFVIAISAIMITSLWYEWFEWFIAMTLSPKDAESYNGQQGDMWDAHKDMLTATIGSLLWYVSYRRPVSSQIGNRQA